MNIIDVNTLIGLGHMSACHYETGRRCFSQTSQDLPFQEAMAVIMYTGVKMERYADSCVEERDRFVGGASVMAWVEYQMDSTQLLFKFRQT